MAKLSAHGRELARVSREFDTPDDELTVWTRVTYSVRTDGAILRKDDVRFRPDRMDPDGRRYSYGWKLYKRKAFGGGTLAQRGARARARLPELLERWKADGWTIEAELVSLGGAR